MTDNKNPTLRESLTAEINAQLHPDGEPADDSIQDADNKAAPPPDGEEVSAKDQGIEDANDSGVKESTEGEDAEKGIQAPATWSSEDQTAFMEIPEEAQRLLMGIHKNMEAGLTKGQAEVSDLRKRYKSLDNFFDSFQQTYLPRSDKGSVESAVMQALPNVMGYYVALQNNPVDTLLQLADTYGAREKLSEALSGYVEDEGDRTLRNENLRLKQQLQELSFKQNQDDVTSAKTVIDNFSNEKTNDGALKHPQFEAVRNTMHTLMKANEALDMETAYQKAVLIDKTDEALADHKAEWQREQSEERKINSREARKTPRRNAGKSGGSSRQEKSEEVPTKIGDHLRLEMAKQQDDMEG